MLAPLVSPRCVYDNLALTEQLTGKAVSAQEHLLQLWLMHQCNALASQAWSCMHARGPRPPPHTHAHMTTEHMLLPLPAWAT